MSTEQNKAIVRRIVGEAVPGRDADMLGQLYAPNYVCYGLNGESMDRQTTLQFAHMMMTAFPDMQVTIHHQIAEDDTVANRYTMTGTHKGVLQGIPPTGKRVSVAGMSQQRLEGGRVVEEWPGLDMLSLLQQLGVLPAVT